MRLPTALGATLFLSAASSGDADNVILITLDGVRIQSSSPDSTRRFSTGPRIPGSTTRK
jgi:hypothetical protein